VRDGDIETLQLFGVGHVDRHVERGDARGVGGDFFRFAPLPTGDLRTGDRLAAGVAHRDFQGMHATRGRLGAQRGKEERTEGQQQAERENRGAFHEAKAQGKTSCDGGGDIATTGR